MAVGDRVLGQVVDGYVETVGAVADTIVAYTVPDNWSVGLRATVVGQDVAAPANEYGYHGSAAANAAGGAATLQGTCSNEQKFPAASAYISFDASGATVRVRTTGVAGQTVKWFCRLEVIRGQTV